MLFEKPFCLRRAVAAEVRRGCAKGEAACPLLSLPAVARARRTQRWCRVASAAAVRGRVQRLAGWGRRPRPAPQAKVVYFHLTQLDGQGCRDHDKLGSARTRPAPALARAQRTHPHAGLIRRP